MNKPLPPAAAGSLRERLIEDMSLRGFSEKTQRYYIRIVSRFGVFLGRIWNGKAKNAQRSIHR